MLYDSYSGIITKGLGLPACAGLITMGFGVFSVTISVTSRPGPGGYAARHVSNVPGTKSSSPYLRPTATSRATAAAAVGRGLTSSNFYVPAPKDYGKVKHIVTISTVIKGRKREKIFTVRKETAEAVIKVSKLYHATAKKANVVVSGLRAIVKALIPPTKNDNNK